MKRFAVSLVLLLLIITTYVTELVIIDRKYDSVTESIEKIEKLSNANDFDGMKRESEKLSQKWENDETVFTLFINHSSIDDITCNISKLRALSTEETAAQFRSELNCIKTGLSRIKDSEKPKITNMF